jgi:hypothetical protein
MKTTVTKTERAALRRWYGINVSQMEALFAADTLEACEEAIRLGEPTFEEFRNSKRAARDAAWAIIHRARQGRS